LGFTPTVSIALQQEPLWYGMVWYGMVWYGMVNVNLYSAVVTKSLMRWAL